jgi:uncharacterized protein (DUF3820 family)
MADYFAHFSCILDVGTPEKAAQALDFFLRLSEKDEASDDPKLSGFALALQDGPGNSVLWFHDDGQGDVEGVIGFVLRLAAEIDLTGLWGFDYAHSCSRPRLEALGGGAHVINLGARKRIGWISTHEWLSSVLNGEDIDAAEALAQ